MSWNCNQYSVGKCKVASRLRGALAVIHTWATFDNGSMFDRQHIADLCKKVIAETDALQSVKKTVLKTNKPKE